MAISVTENRRGGMAMVGVAVKTSATELPSASPTITSGSGAPTATEPNGCTAMSIRPTPRIVAVITFWAIPIISAP